MKKQYDHSSDTLLKIIKNKKTTGYLTYQDILSRLGEHAFGIILLFFSLPSVLPLSAIPGISFIFSVPIVLFAFQMILAKKSVWLPNIILSRKIQYQTIYKIISTAVPYLKKVERILKPRLLFMTNGLMERINGIVVFCLALLLMLPIPFSNFFWGMLLIIFSLGLIEKDGFFIILGYVGSLIYMSFTYLLILTAINVII